MKYSSPLSWLIATVCIIILSSNILSSQIRFDSFRNYGSGRTDKCKSAIKDSDQIILAGDTNGAGIDVSYNHGKSDFWLVTLNKDGKIDWQQCYGGTSDEILTEVVKGFSNYKYLFGTSKSKEFGSDDYSEGEADFWMISVIGPAPSPGYIDNHSFHAGDYTRDELRYARKDPNGGYIFSGWGFDPNDYTGTNVVIKTNASGQEWKADVGFTVNYIAATENGYVLYGSKTGSLDYNGENLSVSSFNLEHVTSRKEISTGSMISGHEWVSEDDNKPWLAKYDDGSLAWKYQFDQSMDEITDFHETQDKGFLALGVANEDNLGPDDVHYGKRDTWIMKFDVDGNLEWKKNFGAENDDYFHTILEIGADKYALIGYSDSNTGRYKKSYGSYDFWMAEIDIDYTDCAGIKNGLNVFDQCGVCDDDELNDDMCGIVAVEDTNVFFGFVPMNTEKSMPITIMNDGFGPLEIQDIIIESDDFYCNETAFSIESKEEYELTVFFKPTEDIDYVSEMILESVDESVTISLTGVGVFDTGINENSFGEIQVLPNPNNGLFSLNFNTQPLKNSLLRVFDANGKVLKNIQVVNANTQIDLTEFGAGIYYLYLKNEGGVLTEKIVVH